MYPLGVDVTNDVRFVNVKIRLCALPSSTPVFVRAVVAFALRAPYRKLFSLFASKRFEKTHSKRENITYINWYSNSSTSYQCIYACVFQCVGRCERMGETNMLWGALGCGAATLPKRMPSIKRCALCSARTFLCVIWAVYVDRHHPHIRFIFRRGVFATEGAVVGCQVIFTHFAFLFADAQRRNRRLSLIPGDFLFFFSLWLPGGFCCSATFTQG